MIYKRFDDIRKNNKVIPAPEEAAGNNPVSKRLDGLSASNVSSASTNREIVRKEIMAAENGKQPESENLSKAKKEDKRQPEEKKKAPRELSPEEKMKKLEEEQIEKRNREQLSKTIEDRAASVKNSLKKHTLPAVKLIASYSLLTALFLAVAYAVCAVLVLRFGVDNKLTRRLDEKIPIPAVITDYGMITYAEYLAIDAPSADEKIRSALESSIIRRLLRKHGAGPAISPDGLARLVMLDGEINRVALARMSQIKNEIGKKGFDDVFKKYGDEYNAGEYITRQDAGKKFNDTLIGYGGDKISPILAGDKGLYIVKVVENRLEPIGIRYVFVKTKNLDEYLDEEIRRLKIRVFIK